MSLPEDHNLRLAILILRAAHCSHDDVMVTLGIGKQTSVDTVKWFKRLGYDEARKFCGNDKDLVFRQLIKPSHVLVESRKRQAERVTVDYILGHYGKVAGGDRPKIELVPRPRRHYERLARAAGKLLLNIKMVANTRDRFQGDVTQGSIEGSDLLGTIVKNRLENVDRLDASCLLEHIHDMYRGNQLIVDIKNWQDYDSREKVRELQDWVKDILKDLSHGLKITGNCHICRSWQERAHRSTSLKKTSV